MAERGAGPEATGCAVRLDESLLGSVFGILGVARYQIGGTKRHRLMHAHQLLVGGGTSLSGPLGELCVLQGGGRPSR